MELAQEDEARVELPVPVSFLGQDVLAFDIDGRGQIRFVDTRRSETDPAWLVPYAPEDTEGLLLSVRGSVDANLITLDFTWKDGSDQLVERSRTEWQTDTGIVSWCLVDVASSSDLSRSVALRFWSGAALEDAPPHDIDWTADEDWSGLLGFRGTHPAETVDEIGERWEISPNETGGFLLRRTSVGRPTAAQLRLHAQPSPFRHSTEVRLYAPAEDDLTVAVYAADGRLVRELASGPAPRGLSIYEWDGRNDAGRESPAGRYWIEARGKSSDAVIPVVRIR
ncbi:MAG: FlgD immunoglobulin-like domain containing protein [Candidatus Eisenbacteria bacterium]